MADTTVAVSIVSRTSAADTSEGDATLAGVTETDATLVDMDDVDATDKQRGINATSSFFCRCSIDQNYVGCPRKFLHPSRQ